MINGNQGRHPRVFILLLGLACATMLGLGSFTGVRAETTYSYIDDQGNPVFTNALETIPQKYRSRVKTHERADSVADAPSVMDSVRQTVESQAKSLGAKAPAFQLSVEGLSPAQSKIFTYAGAAAIVLLLIMYLSKKSPMLRLLALGLLIVLGLGAPVLMYVSDGGSMDVMKKKATASGQAQHDRLNQVTR